MTFTTVTVRGTTDEPATVTVEGRVDADATADTSYRVAFALDGTPGALPADPGAGAASVVHALDTRAVDAMGNVRTGTVTVTINP